MPKLLSLLAAVTVASALGTAVQAAPVKWTVTSGSFTDGTSVSGSFVYDADLDSYTSINLVTATGVRTGQTYTGWTNRSATYLNSQSAARTDYLDVNFGAALTNAGGTVTVTTIREGLCTVPSCLTNTLSRESVGVGSIVGVPVPPIPTLSEWAMILMGGLLAIGALVALQGRRMLGLNRTV